MDKIKERNKKFYTEHGLKALKNKMDNFINLFNNYGFPFEAPMLGFGKFKIETKEECLHRIKDLAQITGQRFEIKRETIKEKDKVIIKEKIEVKDGS